MRARGFIGLLLLGAGLGCSTGGTSGDPIDHNSPPTFLYPCGGDAGICRTPFTCLKSSSAATDGATCGSEPFCTNACSTDRDCPHWIATGHCAGPVQAVCNCGLCGYLGGCN